MPSTLTHRWRALWASRGAVAGIRVWLLTYFALSVGLLGAGLIYWSWVDHQARVRSDALHAHNRAQVDELAQLRVYFSDERVAWSEVLLRGRVEADYHALLSNYYARERAARDQMSALAAFDKVDAELQERHAALAAAHTEISRARREALRVLNTSATNAQVLADRLVRPIENRLPASLDDLGDVLQAQETARTAALRDEEARQRGWLLTALLVLALLCMSGFAVLLDRRVGRPAQRAAELAAISATAEELAGFGFWIASPDGKIFWSPGMHRLFGWPAQDEAQFERAMQAANPQDRQAFLQASWRPEDGVQEADFRITRDDGQPRDLRLVISTRAVEDKRRLVRSGVALDITEQQAQRQALEQLNAELEARVSARTAELESARNEAQRLAAVKSDFLSNMSHEIRTPMNAVLGFARIGARDSNGALDTKGQPIQAVFSRILDAGEHLLRVINDVLDLSKIEAGKLLVESRPFALAVVLANSGSFVAGAARQKGIAFATELLPGQPPYLHGDALRLQQILVSLLSNAVKFTRQGEVRLTVERSGELTLFKVTDTGPGIAAADLARLFESFEQVDGSTTREHGGTGLGLAISLKLARLMDGNISVQSTPGAGSTFTLSLPLPEVSGVLPEPTPALPAAGRRLARLRVLAAEDVEINRILLADMLAHEGAQAVFADNGAQALERLADLGAAAFDVVLMDVQMPVMDGYEATRHMLAVAPELPIIGVTAHAMTEERLRCFEAGMVDQVTKPVVPAELVAAILRHVTLRGAGGAPEAGPARPSAAQPAASAPSTASAARGTIDWRAVGERYKGGPNLVRRLMASLRESHGGSPLRLRALVAEGNLAKLAALAHELKGMGANLLAQGLHQHAAQAEAAARAASPDAAGLALELADELEAVLARLDKGPPLAGALPPGAA